MADAVNQLDYNNSKFTDIINSLGYSEDKKKEVLASFNTLWAYVDKTSPQSQAANFNVALSSTTALLRLNSVYTVVNANSGYWNTSIATLLAGSVFWNDVYTTVKNNSASWAGGGTGSLPQSADWNSVYSLVNSNSAAWDASTTIIDLSSIFWSSVYTNVNGNSANWNRAFTMGNILGGLSANAQSVYNTTNTFSATWGAGGDNVPVTNLVQNTSANWNRAYDMGNLLGELSANGQSVYSNTNSNSANWNTAYNQSNILAETSANNASNYSTVNANSATWGAGGDDVAVSTLVRATSAQWNLAKAETSILGELSANAKSVYSQVNSKSANWDIAYNQSNILAEASAANAAVVSNVNTNSVNWNRAYVMGNLLGELSGNASSVYTQVNLLSANWSSAYTTVNANSFNWNLAFAQTNILGELSANSQSVFSTVNANSATWGTGGGDDVPVTNLVRSTSANWNSVYSSFNLLSAYSISNRNTYTHTPVVTSGADSTSTQIAADDTLPQNTEGKEYLTLTMTPKDPNSSLLVEFSSWYDGAASCRVVTALFKDNDADALGATTLVVAGANQSQNGVLRTFIPVAGSGERTYKIRFGPSGTLTTAYILRRALSQLYSTANQSVFTVTEILPLSAEWGTPADLTELSTTVHTNSANWNSNYSTVRSTSANWNSTYSSFNSFSANRNVYIHTPVTTGLGDIHNSVIPLDESIPQNTEGREYMKITITPKNPNSTLLVDFIGWGHAFTAGGVVTVATFKDNDANALAAYAFLSSQSEESNNLSTRTVITSAGSGARTYKIRYGAHTGFAEMMRYNSVGFQNIFSTAKQASLTVTEILPA